MNNVERGVAITVSLVCMAAGILIGYYTPRASHEAPPARKCNHCEEAANEAPAREVNNKHSKGMLLFVCNCKQSPNRCKCGVHCVCDEEEAPQDVGPPIPLPKPEPRIRPRGASDDKGASEPETK